MWRRIGLVILLMMLFSVACKAIMDANAPRSKGEKWLEQMEGPQP